MSEYDHNIICICVQIAHHYHFHQIFSTGEGNLRSSAVDTIGFWMFFNHNGIVFDCHSK